MILPDVNVLIGAFRQHSPHHAVCRPWLEAIFRADARFAMSPLALSAVARITTHSKPFHMPSTLDEVFGFCDYLLSQPHCQIVEPGARHWNIFKRLCIEAKI